MDGVDKPTIHKFKVTEFEFTFDGGATSWNGAFGEYEEITKNVGRAMNVAKNSEELFELIVKLNHGPTLMACAYLGLKEVVDHVQDCKKEEDMSEKEIDSTVDEILAGTLLREKMYKKLKKWS